MTQAWSPDLQKTKPKHRVHQVILKGMHQLSSKLFLSSPHFHTGSGFPVKEIRVHFPDGISNILQTIPASLLQASGLSMLCSRKQQICTPEKSLTHACVGGFRELQVEVRKHTKKLCFTVIV